MSSALKFLYGVSEPQRILFLLWEREQISLLIHIHASSLPLCFDMTLWLFDSMINYAWTKSFFFPLRFASDKDPDLQRTLQKCQANAIFASSLFDMTLWLDSCFLCSFSKASVDKKMFLQRFVFAIYNPMTMLFNIRIHVTALCCVID